MIQKAHVGIGIMGKEGNQASSFADYAIPKFKDLRRLLYWHGCTFGSKLSNFCLMVIFKSLIFGSSVWFFNFTCMLSGIHTVDDAIWAFYPISMTFWAPGFYTTFEHTISYSKYGTGDEAEKELIFKLRLLFNES